VTGAPPDGSSPPCEGDAASGWEARLALGFRRHGKRTVLALRAHEGPLVVQKALYPEGESVCQAMIVHPPGGIAGGDRLALDIDVGPGAHAQLTTAGAAKWYRSAGARARSTVRAHVASGATLEWLPQEVIVFDAAQAALTTLITLGGDAVYLGWDVVCLGRMHSGERFASGRLCQALEIVRDGAPIWCERTALDGGSPALQSGAILDGAPVFGTFIATGDIVDGVLASCRNIACDDGNGAVTRLPRVFVARYRGRSASAARTYFATLWRMLRPVLVGREALSPRIWST
jgi:urease accessory protein